VRRGRPGDPTSNFNSMGERGRPGDPTSNFDSMGENLRRVVTVQILIQI
jgi:hypothetical protein